MNDIARLTYKIIDELRNNDNLFKLIKYDTSDALEKPNLNDDEKDELIKGELDIKNKRIFKSSFNNNTIEDVRTELRIYKDFIPQEKCLAKTQFYFEVIIHRNVWDLNNGSERADEILFELLKSLNNKDISGIGYLKFENPVKHICPAKDFNGYILSATTRIEW